MCKRQSRKVIRDMISTLFLTTVPVEPTFVAFLQHSQTHFHGLSYQFFQISLKNSELKNTHNAFRDCREIALFPTTFLEIAVVRSKCNIFSIILFHLFFLCVRKLVYTSFRPFVQFFFALIQVFIPFCQFSRPRQRFFAVSSSLAPF